MVKVGNWECIVEEIYVIFMVLWVEIYVELGVFFYKIIKGIVFFFKFFNKGWWEWCEVCYV